MTGLADLRRRLSRAGRSHQREGETRPPVSRTPNAPSLSSPASSADTSAVTGKTGAEVADLCFGSMIVDTAAVARGRKRLETCFIQWHTSPFPMSVVEQRLLVSIIKRYDARAAKSAVARGREPKKERLEGAGKEGRGGVAEGVTGSRRPVVEAVEIETGEKQKGGGSRASRSSSGESGGGREEAAATDGLLGEDAVYSFSRSSAQNALCPGYFSMDRSEWLDKLETMLPASGRAEVHYLNATGYWLGLSAAAGDMATEGEVRSGDEVTALLAFSQVLAGVGARVLATRFGYFDLIVSGSGDAAESFLANAEAADVVARNRVFEAEGNQDQEGFASEAS